MGGIKTKLKKENTFKYKQKYTWLGSEVYGGFLVVILFPIIIFPVQNFMFQGLSIILNLIEKLKHFFISLML